MLAVISCVKHDRSQIHVITPVIDSVIDEIKLENDYTHTVEFPVFIDPRLKQFEILSGNTVETDIEGQGHDLLLPLNPFCDIRFDTGKVFDYEISGKNLTVSDEDGSVTLNQLSLRAEDILGRWNYLKDYPSTQVETILNFVENDEGQKLIFTKICKKI